MSIFLSLRIGVGDTDRHSEGVRDIHPHRHHLEQRVRGGTPLSYGNLWYQLDDNLHSFSLMDRVDLLA
jgi:hypothetical protein